MNTMLGQWEDEENNRQVQFSIDYTIEDSSIEIKSVTPNKVSFVCPESNTVVRTIGVHTESLNGREGDYAPTDR